MGWYVLQVLTGKEFMVAERLGMMDIETLVPIEGIMERRGQRWEEVNRIMFPGYVFLQVGLDYTRYYQIKNVPCIIHFLGKDHSDLPETIPDAEMEPWLLLKNNGLPFSVSEAERGDDGRTRIRSGPLKPLEDRIVSVDARQRRATVELKINGKAYRIVVGIRMTSNPEQAADEQSPCEKQDEKMGQVAS